MKKILLGIFILIIGIGLYIILNQEHSTLQQKSKEEDLHAYNEEPIVRETTSIKNDKNITNTTTTTNEEATQTDSSTDSVRIANHHEIQFYNEQMEEERNKDYLNQEEPIYQNNNQIFLNLEGEHKKVSVGKDEYFRPNLSPSKTYLSYEDSNGIIVQNIANGSVKKLDDDASGASWHPDEEIIVYARVKDDGTVLTESQIYTYNVATNQETIVPSAQNRILVDPIFSEDGSSIYAQDDSTNEIITLSVKK